jgi:hypothetical protein
MVDVVTRLTAPLAPGSDAHAVIRFHGGGSAANTAAWLARAGVRASQFWWAAWAMTSEGARQSTSCERLGSTPSWPWIPSCPRARA